MSYAQQRPPLSRGWLQQRPPPLCLDLRCRSQLTAFPTDCIVGIFEICEGFADTWWSFSNSNLHSKREDIEKTHGNRACDAATLAGSATRAPKMPCALQDKAKRWSNSSKPTAFKCNRTSLSLQNPAAEHVFVDVLPSCCHGLFEIALIWVQGTGRSFWRPSFSQQMSTENGLGPICADMIDM